jgi:hypothetical protein
VRAYLGLVAKDPGRRIEPRAFEAAATAAGEAVPVPAAEVSGAEWLGTDHGVALVSWSNEPVHELLPEPLKSGGSRVLGYCGYLTDPVTAEDRLLTAEDLGSTLEEQGGCFSVFRAGANGIEAATSIARVCPVYYAETADLHIVGSRALLVHLVARSMATGLTRPEVDFDVMALQAMVRHGFFTTDETPFRGVRALPAASVLTLRRGEPRRIEEGRMPETAPAPRSPLEARESVARLADALVSAAGPLARHGQPVTLALSGGRDSRIMAAVLNAAGVPLRSRTHGFADDPDVILGTRIAAALGIESKVALTDAGSREDTVSVEHPLRRAHHVIRMCEGMTSAYEQVSSRQPYRLGPRTSGSGGETLRGGFLCGQQDLSPGGFRKRVRMIFHASDRFLSAEANEHAEANHRPWAERVEKDGFDVLDKLYLFYRTGRWIVGSHTATLMNAPYYHPLLDNRVVRETLTLPAAWRCSEEAVFGLLETLAPELAAIPPEGKRWRFEEHRPRSLREWRGWRHRAPLLPKGRTSGFNWRTSYDEGFQTLLRDQIMTSPPELFDIVDEPAAKELLSTAPGRSPKNIWHIFTLSVLLSGQWREAAPSLPDVAIPLPARP